MIAPRYGFVPKNFRTLIEYGLSRPASGRHRVAAPGVYSVAAAFRLSAFIWRRVETSMIHTLRPCVATTISFAVVGWALGGLEFGLLTALPSRIIGLLENDLLQALPLYVLMGALLNHLPLAGTLFRVGRRVLRGTGAPDSLASLGLAAVLAPMSGSVGASALMLGRTVQPRIDASGLPRARGAA